MMLESHWATCPSCWERIELTIDPTAGSQQYTEDCFVCCRPMLVNIRVDDADGAVSVSVQAEAD